MNPKIVGVFVTAFMAQILFIESGSALSFPRKGFLPPALNASFNEMDDFAESITLYPVMEAVFEIPNPEMKHCYEDQKDAYEKILDEFKNKIEKFVEEFGEDLQSTEQIIYERAQRNLYKIDFSVTSYPKKIWNLIQSGDFSDAGNVLFDYKNQVQFTDVKVLTQLKKLEAKKPEVAEKAKKHYRAIREEAKNKCNDIAGNIAACINSKQ